MNTSRMTGAALVGAGLILAVGGVLTYYCDPKYYPLIGWLSVPLSALGLWLGYLYQANPFRVELHKRQIDVISGLLALAQKGCDVLYRWENDRRSEDWGDHFEVYADLTKQSEMQVLLPNTVMAALTEFILRYSECARKIGGARERTRDNTPLLGELERHKREFVTVCREAIHTDRLTEGTKQLLERQRVEHMAPKLSPAGSLADPAGTTGDEQSDDPEAVARWIAAFGDIPPLQMNPDEEAAWRSARATQKQIDATAIERLVDSLPVTAK